MDTKPQGYLGSSFFSFAFFCFCCMISESLCLRAAAESPSSRRFPLTESLCFFMFFWRASSRWLPPHRGASAARGRLTWGCGRTVRSRLLAARVKFEAARGPRQLLRCVGRAGASRARAGAHHSGNPASPARKAGGGPRPTQGSPQVAACRGLRFRLGGRQLESAP